MGSVATGVVWYGCSGSDIYGKVGSCRYWFGCYGWARMVLEGP